MKFSISLASFIWTGVFFAAGFSGALCAKEKTVSLTSTAVAPTLNGQLVDGVALVRDWVPPVYPANALKEKIGGRVMARIVVDETGHVAEARVLEATDPRLGGAAVVAVKEWTFLPAVENATPVAMCLDVPFEFDAAKGNKSWKAGGVLPAQFTPQPAPRIAVQAKKSPAGIYPEALANRQLSGQVVFGCTVQADGRAGAVQILAATHADFVLPALAAIAQWEFTPAEQGDLKVSAEWRAAITFEAYESNRAQVFAANDITTPDGAALGRPPAIEHAIDPIWPHALLLKGEGGTATVEFTVQPSGSVAGVKVLEASQPEFGRTLAAAMAGWKFNAGTEEGRIEPVTFVKRAEFKALALDDKAPTTDPLVRLVRVVRAGEIVSGGLDEKLTPLYRVAPIYPADFGEDVRPAGQAVIEFVIDRDGRARLPRIVSATRDEFGWAAATAVAQWIFKAPLRAGKPTEVKVQIPINFSAPEA